MVVDYEIKLQFDLTTYKNGRGFPLGLGGYFKKAKQSPAGVMVQRDQGHPPPPSRWRAALATLRCGSSL